MWPDFVWPLLFEGTARRVPFFFDRRPVLFLMSGLGAGPQTQCMRSCCSGSPRCSASFGLGRVDPGKWPWVKIPYPQCTSQSPLK